MRGSIVALLLSLFAMGLFIPAEAQQDEKDYGQTLNNVDLQSYTLYVQKKTKKRFLWTEDLGLKNKRVNFRSFFPVDKPEDIFKLYQSILQVSDLMLVPVPSEKEGEEIYKIQAAPTGMKRALPVIKDKIEASDKFITKLFKLAHVNPRDVHAALINMATYPQGILAIESAGLLLISDYDYNIARFEQIIQQMDMPKPDILMRRIELKFALASDVETMMNTLVQTIIARATAQRFPQQPGVPGQEPVKIVADKRTNSVLILAEPARIDQIEKIIRELDSETGFETSGIYITHLRHVNALDMVRTLNAMYRIAVDDKGVPSGGTGTRPGQSVGPGTPPGTTGTPTTGTSLTGNEPTIVADTRSNSVIMITDRNTYKSLESIIRRLDQRRPQVLIKATVVEVRSNDRFDMGVELARLVDPDDRAVVVGRSQFGYSTLVPDTANNTFTLTPVDTTGITLALLRDKIGNIGALVKAVEEKAKVTILDEPEVATIDNGNAEMKVTNQVPILQTTFTASGLAQTTFNKFETAETTLSISPHISDAGYLRLDTKVKIEKFTRESADPTIPPPKTSREINTNSILVPNGRTVVIGGIVTQDTSEAETGIPLLSHIPIIGFLFKRNTNTGERRTLYIFITPYILYDESFGDLGELTKERKEEIEKLRGETLARLQVEPPTEPVPSSTFRFSGPRDLISDDRRKK